MNRPYRTKPDRFRSRTLKILRLVTAVFALALLGVAVYTALALFNVFDALGWTYYGALSQAYRALQAADYDSAIDACNRALRYDSDGKQTRLLEGEPYALRGHAWTGKGDLEKALSDYTTAIAHSSDAALPCRGHVYEQMGKLPEATKDYCEAILRERDSRIGVLLIAEARTWKVKQGRAAVADMIRFFDRAIERQPRNEDLRTCRRLLDRAVPRPGQPEAASASRSDQ